MIRTTIRAAIAAGLLTVAAALPAHAQLSSPIRFNVHGGAALPMGDFGDFVNTGFTLGGGLTFSPPLSPVGLRVDGAFNQFGEKDFDDNISIWSITANAELGLAPMVYLIGGVGYYSTSGVDALGSRATETDLGLNIGAGVRIPLTGFDAFAEARYHTVRSEPLRTNYLPIVFGIRF